MRWRYIQTAGIALLSTSAVGCNATSGVGIMQNIAYTLHSDFVAEEGNITGLSIVTGHEQWILTDLTAQGAEEAGEEKVNITHSVFPATDSVLIESHKSRSDVPNFDVTVFDAGTYKIMSLLGYTVIDYIYLTFEQPNEMEVVTWVLAPDTEEWIDFSGFGPHTIEVGSQATFLPIPRRNGERLAGDIAVDLYATPEEAIVQGENVNAVYEQNVVTSTSPVSIFLVEEGEVAITLDDAANSLAFDVSFIVE